MNSKEQFKDEGYDLAKAMHHVSIGQKYFEMIALGYQNGAKLLMNQLANRCHLIITNVYDRLGDETRQFYRESLIKGDTVFADAISDKLLQLNEEQKVAIEKFVDGLIKGEVVEYTYIDAETKEISVILPK